jgi:hypothetical protein
MDKYRLVQEHTADEGIENDNNDDSTMSCEVRITQQGKPRNYISYAMKLFVRLPFVDYEVLAIVLVIRGDSLLSL